MNAIISRRRLAQVAAGLVVSFSLPAGRALAQAQVDPSAIPTAGFGGKPVSPTIVESYIAIHKDGQVTLYTGKVELGTGVQTALTQILAEELDVPFAAVSTITGDTALTPDQGPTSGSQTIQAGGMQIRHAAATARRELLTLAASHLKAPVSALTVKDGVVRAASGGSVTYGELLPAWKPLTLNVDNAAPLKSPADYTLVGKSVPRVDIPAKMFATYTYVQDFRLPGMLHGRVIRPPAVGATLLSVDHSSVPASVQIVRKGNFLAVAATDEWAAIKAARSLKATWSDVQNLPDQDKLYDYVRSSPVTRDQVTSSVGNAEAALAAAPRKLKATYEVAIQTHGSIGPSCSVAAMEDGVMTVWTPAQSSHNLRKQLAAMLNMPVEKVRCIFVPGAGCYGRNGFEDVGADAALMAQALGKPVRVQWMRQDEHGWDPKAPPVVIDMEAGLDASGKVQAWNALFWYPETTGVNVSLLGADLAGLPSDGGNNPGNIVLQLEYPVPLPEHQDDGAPSRQHAAAARLAADARADAEHLRQRVVPGRNRRGIRRRSAGSAPADDAGRSARPGGAAASRGDLRLAPPAEGRPACRDRHRLGHVLSQIRDGSHLCGGRGGSRRGPFQRCRAGEAVLHRPGLRSGDQPGWDAQPDRGQCDPDAEPRDEGARDLRPANGDEPRLVDLFDHHLPGNSGDRDRR